MVRMECFSGLVGADGSSLLASVAQQWLLLLNVEYTCTRVLVGKLGCSTIPTLLLVAYRCQDEATYERRGAKAY
jgi:hypothetical protein